MVGGMYWSLRTPAYAPRWLIMAILSIALLTRLLERDVARGAVHATAWLTEETTLVVHRQVAERSRRVDEILARLSDPVLPAEPQHERPAWTGPWSTLPSSTLSLIVASGRPMSYSMVSTLFGRGPV